MVYLLCVRNKAIGNWMELKMNLNHDIELAKFICSLRSVTNIQLQHIMFILSQEYYKVEGEIPVYGYFEAWQFGACLPRVFYYFSGFGAMPIWKDYKYDLDKNLSANVIIEIVERLSLDIWDLCGYMKKMPNIVWGSRGVIGGDYLKT